MPKKKKVLFEESEDEEEEDGELQINKAYANKYQEWRLSEELQKYKDRFGDEDLTSSESSSDEDFAEADNPEFDREFLRTMGALHKKTDPKLEGARFFTGNYSKKKEEKEEKAITVKDYERLMITDHGGELDEEEEVQGWMKGKTKLPKDDKKSDFEDGLSSDDDDSGDPLLKSGFFKVKEPTRHAEEVETKSQEDPFAFLRGESSSVKHKEDRGLLEGLRDVWNDPRKSADEKWLIDYFVNERYNEEEDESKLKPYNGVVIDEEPISDDEKTLETMETFETKYRFRFEEPDEEFIKKYPRIIPDSLRAKDERRKQKRATLKERKEKEKEVKRQEIERLKALKYKEIQAKIERIKEASGNQDIDLGEKLFEDDFDEANHDKVMSDMFGEDYYATQDCDEEKPIFDDDDDIDVIQDYDQWLEKQDASQIGSEVTGDWEEDNEHWDDSVDGGFDNRAEARKALEQEMIEASSKKKGRRRKSKFAMAIKQKKPVFDPVEKTFESYFDEYYQLDFEDIISGVPCRFKYRKVDPNNFGLSTEEILSAQDRELNKWVSLKKMLRYQRDEKEELKDAKMYEHRASLPHVKHKILPSIYVEDPVSHHVAEEEKKRLKNLKKKLRRQQKLEGITGKHDNDSTIKTEQAGDGLNESTTTLETDPKRPSKKTKKRSKDTSYTSQDADEKTAQASAVEITEQPKRKKKKKLKVMASPDDNQSVQNNSSGHKDINQIDKQQLNNNKNEKDKTNAVETKNIIHGSEGQAMKNQKKKKRKAKKQPTSEITQVTKKRNASTLENSIFKGISDSRLAAYGENPKKLKNKVRYGKQNV